MDRDVHVLAHYGGLYGRCRTSTDLPKGLGDDELSDRRILAAASQVLPAADTRFCGEVRVVAAFLHLGLTNPPPSEKRLKVDLEQIRAMVVKLQRRLMSTDYARRTLGELIDLAETEPSGELVTTLKSGAFPAARESAFTAVVTDEEEPKEFSKPEWALDDPVGELLGALEAFEKRLDSRLREPKPRNRPRSVKPFAIRLLRDLIHEFNGSCSENDLKLLAEAYLRPILAIHDDNADLGHHVKNVIKEVDQKTG